MAKPEGEGNNDILAAATHPNIFVILNLFQDPSCGKLSSRLSGSGPPCRLTTTRSGHGAKWVLKPVQDDDAGWV
jgi:hypothetical protein